MPKGRSARVSPYMVDIDQEIKYWVENGGSYGLCRHHLPEGVFLDLVRYAYDGYLRFGLTVEFDIARPLLRMRFASSPRLYRKCTWEIAEIACQAVWSRMKQGGRS